MVRSLDETIPSHLRADLRFALHKRKALLAAIAILCLAHLVRLFFGIDLYDESYYFTHGLRMAQGDLLFTDIWDLTQTQGILLVPLYALYGLFFGANGLILLNRLLLYALSLFTAAWLYEALRGTVSRATAAVAVLCLLIYAPFSLYSMSYNNLAYTFCMLGCALYVCGVRAMAAQQRAKGRIRLLGAGIAHAMMAAAYPTLSLLIILMIVGLAAFSLWERRRGRLSHMLWYVLGLSVIAAGLLLYIAFRCGLQGLLTSLSQMTASPASNKAASLQSLWHDIKGMFQQIAPKSEKKALALWFLAICGFGPLLGRLVDALTARLNKKWRMVTLIALWGLAALLSLVARNGLPLCAVAALTVVIFAGRYRVWLPLATTAMWMAYSAFLLGSFQHGSIAVCELAFAYAIPLPWLMAALDRRQWRTLGIPFGWLAAVSLIMTMLISISSGGGFWQGRYALIGVLMWNALALCVISRQAPVPPWLTPLAKAGLQPWANVGVLLLAASFVFTQSLYVFGDAQINTYAAFMTKGPGAGLYTTQERADLLNGMADDVRALPGTTILCLENFPYGYGLDSTKRAFAPSTWVCSTYSRIGYTSQIYWTNFPDYAEAHHALPDVILYWSPHSYNDVADDQYALHRMIAQSYTLAVDRGSYRLYTLVRP